MKHSGSADLALMGGHIPNWLFERMTKLSLAVVEALLIEHGTKGFLSRLSDPYWFQSFGAVIGMEGDKLEIDCEKAGIKKVVARFVTGADDVPC